MMMHFGQFQGMGSRSKMAAYRQPMPSKACSDKPVILFMDSLSADMVDEMMQNVREYLELEFLEKKVSIEHKMFFTEEKFGWKKMNYERVPHYQPKLPKQKNFTDCGLFVLQYAETFLSEPNFVLDDLHQKEGTLFHQRIVDSKRDEIKRMIIALAEKTITIEQMGQICRQEADRIKGSKTHYKKEAKEESKAKQAMELPEKPAVEKDQAVEDS